jgi:5-methylcytosine-specific restriction endonuclease McrA
VTGSRPKVGPLRLDPVEYETLRKQVLHRDGWRCQSCGTMSNLEVHHQKFRSHSGNDSEENLITLCAGCHANKHHVFKRAPTLPEGVSNQDDG